MSQQKLRHATSAQLPHSCCARQDNDPGSQSTSAAQNGLLGTMQAWFDSRLEQLNPHSPRIILDPFEPRSPLRHSETALNFLCSTDVADVESVASAPLDTPD